MKTRRRKPKKKQAPPLYSKSEEKIEADIIPKQHWHIKQSEAIEKYLSKVA